MRRTTAIVALTIAMLPGESLSAQLSAASRLTLRGTTVDSLGRPVPGVILRVAGGDRSTASDSLGGFRVDSLSAGVVEITFVHPRFASITLALPITANDTTVVPVLLSAREELARITALEPRMLFGIVSDQRGFPIAGAEVLVATDGMSLAALVNLRDLAGVEVYRRGDEAPLEFSFVKASGLPCGVIGLWTR